MLVEKRIKLRNNIYYIGIEVEYKKKRNILTLCLKNNIDDYYDGGNVSLIIEEVEKTYSEDKAKYYDKSISFMADVLYIYNRIPILSYIKDVYISNKDDVPYASGYISKKEIDNYIKTNKVKMYNNSKFSLCDGRTWKLKEDMNAYEIIYSFSFYNKKYLKKYKNCICIHCGKIFDYKLIKSWFHNTALCPYCNVDFVIPVEVNDDNVKFKITKEIQEELKDTFK